LEFYRWLPQEGEVPGGAASIPGEEEEEEEEERHAQVGPLYFSLPSDCRSVSSFPRFLSSLSLSALCAATLLRGSFAI